MSTVNSQITDSVSTTISSVLGNAPAEGFALLDTVMAETVGMMMHNAVNAQQNSQMVSNAAVTATCAKMLQVQPPSSSRSSPSSPPLPPIFSPPGSPPSAIVKSGQNAKNAIQNLANDLENAAGEEQQAKALLQELADTAKADAENGN